MKVLDVAIKDLRRMFFNAFFLVFGVVLPLLTGALFYFAFGGLASGGEGLDLPTVQVQVANQDAAGAAAGSSFSASGMVVEILGTALPGILEVSRAADAAAAREAVDRQQTAVAVIIPAGFSQAVLAPAGRAEVELYQDPTLTFGPALVEALVRRVVDAFAGSKIAVDLTVQELAARELEADPAALQQLAMEYGTWISQLAEAQQAGAIPLLDVRPVGDQPEEGDSGVNPVVGLTMSGMMVFYVFFTGAASAQSILQEDEAGTLPRLFTTPTPQSSILAGKFLAGFGVLIVQVAVLLALSAILFGIDWGDPGGIALVSAGLVVLAASFGICLTSFLKSTRQGGIIYGGVLTVMGMIGMIPIFTAGAPGTAQATRTLSLLVPQGWAARAWGLLLQGGRPEDLLLTVAVMIGLAVLFFIIGAVKFHRRFA